MSVEELIAELQKMPKDAEVILQKDSEGNGYSPLYAADIDCIYVPASTWHGRVYSTDWTWRDADFESRKKWEDFKASNPRACVLAPVN